MQGPKQLKSIVKSTKHANDNSDIDYLFSNKRKKKKVKTGIPRAERKEDAEPTAAREPHTYLSSHKNRYKQLKFKVNKENFTPNNNQASKTQEPKVEEIQEAGTEGLPDQVLDKPPEPVEVAK